MPPNWLKSPITKMILWNNLNYFAHPSSLPLPYCRHRHHQRLFLLLEQTVTVSYVQRNTASRRHSSLSNCQLFGLSCLTYIYLD